MKLDKKNVRRLAQCYFGPMRKRYNIGPIHIREFSRGAYRIADDEDFVAIILHHDPREKLALNDSQGGLFVNLANINNFRELKNIFAIYTRGVYDVLAAKNMRVIR